MDMRVENPGALNPGGGGQCCELSAGHSGILRLQPRHVAAPGYTESTLMRLGGLFVLLINLGLLSACHASDKPAGRSSAHALDTATNRAANDVARFLAGLPGEEGSPYQPLEAEQAWKDHADSMNKLWARFEKNRQTGMRRFGESELRGPGIDDRPVWYPFSGADTLTMLTFFPGHDLYVMAALEPPGVLPKPEELATDTLADRLPGIAGTLASLIGKSFFVTREMDHQLRGQVVDGVTEPMLILLARSGFRILDYGYVQLDDSGKLVERQPAAKRSAFGLNRGITMDVESPAGKRARIVYLSLNLDDRHMTTNTAFKTYIGSLGRTATMLKATSYMLHASQFSQIRSLILDSSALIVQDDSGIPWRYLNTADWQVQLYGDYVQPYGKSFEFRKQPSLREAYETNRASVKPLEFRIGYGAGKVTSNLQVARHR